MASMREEQTAIAKITWKAFARGIDIKLYLYILRIGETTLMTFAASLSESTFTGIAQPPTFRHSQWRSCVLLDL